MPTYIRLHRLTEKGLGRVKELNSVFGETTAQIESLGGKLLNVWVCQGSYDLVSIVEAPDEDTIASIDKAMKRNGDYRGTTLLAMPAQEFVQTFGSSPTATQFIQTWFQASRASRSGR